MAAKNLERSEAGSAKTMGVGGTKLDAGAGGASPAGVRVVLHPQTRHKADGKFAVIEVKPAESGISAASR